MKKINIFLMIFLIILLSGCKKTLNKNEENSDILIAYFSCTNNTKRVAQIIHEKTQGTLWEIVPEIPYTPDDIGYSDDSRALFEKNDPDSRPAIKNTIDNFNDYETIYLGYPIWWDDAPRIIYTFLESYDFSNKKIIPFCTSGSSSITGSLNNIKGLAENANWQEGKRFSENFKEEEVISWLENSEVNMVYFSIGSYKIKANLVDNEATRELIKKLPLTLELSDYAGNEKVGPLGFSLPTDNEQITTNPGEFVLYNGNQFVIFYGHNTWSYTRLGKVDISLDELNSILGSGDVSLTISLE